MSDTGSEKIELVGGPRDGQFVDDWGPCFREPAREVDPYRAIRLAPPEIAHLDFPTVHDGPRIIEYRKHRDARDGHFFYLCVQQ